MKRFILFAGGIFLFFNSSSFCQSFPSGFSSTTISSGWSEPIGTAFTPDGQKLFVWEKSGKVFVCNRDGSGNYVKQSTPVIDISPEVGNWRDYGLLGFALDPQFAANGLIYLLYVVDRHYLMNFGTASYNPNTNDYFKATIGRLTRYKTITSGGNLTTDYSTRTILIGETKKTGIPILHESHGMGTLAFVADGTLLVSAGDGGSYNIVDDGNGSDTYYAQALADTIIRANENVGAFRSQMLNSHNGKVLRIDPATGNGMPSNPFYDAAQPRSPKSRVWALGFRNPFRMVVRPGTGSTNPSTGDIGEIYVSDVGWGTWEELNIIKEAGMNCGWPLYEGHTALTDYYNLNLENKDEPNPLYGTGGCTQQYFKFKDLLKQATADGITTVYNPCNTSQAIGTGNRYFHRRPAIDCKHDQDIARVGIFSGNTAAVATIGTAASGVTGAPYRGNCAIAGCWYTGNLFPVNFRNTFFMADYGRTWIKTYTVNYTDVIQKVENFADGFLGIVSITENPLDGTIVCVDNGNNTIKRVTFGGNQLPVVRMSSDKTYGPTALAVNFTGNTSYDPEGGNITYLWKFGDNTTSTAANPSHTFTAPASTPTRFAVKLTVTDNQGGASTDSIIISVNNTPPVVNITSPVKNSTYTLGPDTLYACTAAVTDAEHLPSQLKYVWQSFLRHNNHQHPEPIDTNRITSTVISRIGCNGDTYYWFIKLTVTDAAGLSTTDSSKIYPPCAEGALPLVLKKFSVTQQGNDNLVKWVTETAYQIKYFEVERGIDGRNFFSINRQAAMNTSDIHEYSFSDNSFLPGVNYYRLKMIEVGDVIRYSVIIRTGSKIKAEGLEISPNPIVGNFSVRYNATENGPVIIRIVDISGREVTVVHESVNRGQNIIYLQNLPSWSPGMYLLTVQQDNNIQQGKLIKAE